jgi:hypothetical protein
VAKKKSVKRVRESLKSDDKTLLEVSGENEEKKISARKVKK